VIAWHETFIRALCDDNMKQIDRNAVLQVCLFPNCSAQKNLFHLELSFDTREANLIATSLTLSSHSFFKTLVDTEVTVELKNDISIRGTLKSVDQYLNIKLDDISVLEEIKYPHLVSGSPGT